MDIAKIYEFKMLNMTMKILFIDLSLALHVLTEKMVSTFFTGHAFKFQQWQEQLDYSWKVEMTQMIIATVD